ncbi:MAG: FliG C-terminal domain-containing protein [Planctomycetota bacterium]
MVATLHFDGAALALLRALSGPERLELAQNLPDRDLALLLAHLEGADATWLLTRLPEPRRAPVLLALVRLGGDEKALLTSAATRLKEAVKALLERRQASRVAAALLMRLSHRDRVASLSLMPEPERRALETELALRPPFRDAPVFEDLEKAAPKGLQSLMVRVPRETLALAYAGASEGLRRKISANLSASARETLLALASDAARSDPGAWHQAQVEVMTLAMQMALTGELSVEDPKSR